MFWLVPPDPHAQSVEAAYVDFSRPACEAFKSQGVKRVVGISALGRGTALAGNAGYVTGLLAKDDLIVSTGVSYRALTIPSFMDNAILQIGSLKSQGVFFSPTPGDLKLRTCATRDIAAIAAFLASAGPIDAIGHRVASIKSQGLFFDIISGDLKQPNCATCDIAAVAARLLLDPSWSGQGSVPVLGPEDLSFNDMAHIMSEVLGRPIRFQQIPGEAFKANLIQSGMSEAMAQGMLDMMIAKSEGIDNAEPRTPESTTPTSFRQWCEEVLKPAFLA